jgi:ABC-2 type transport system ATP-binding protein
MNVPAIAAASLTKCFDARPAVRDLSFEVEAGTVYGLCGTNGAGKSTTILMLLGLLPSSAGCSQVLGEDSRRLSRGCRQRIGYLSEKPIEDHGLPLGYLLHYVAAFFDDWDWDRSRRLVDSLEVPLDQPLASMSYGERRRCELVLTLAQDPDLLVLDDPAVGLDATVRRDFLWGALEAARQEGKTVLFTSHILHDVERIVDTIGILHDGELVVHSELDDLLGRTKRIVVEGGVQRQLPQLRGEIERRECGRDLIIVTGEYDDQLERELSSLEQIDSSIEVEDMNLEEVFCAVVDQPSHDEAGAAS